MDTKMMKRLTTSGAIVAMLAFESLGIALLVKELIESSFRATDRVLILLALIFLPLLLLFVLRMFEGSKHITVKLLDKLEVNYKDLEEKVERHEQRIEEQLVGKLSTAELTLYPLIGGADTYASERLANKKVIIGSKDFAANIVVSELLAQWLQSHSIQVERRFPNGGTITNYACLINDWIDVFVDYTGTGCLFMNITHRGKTLDQLLDELNGISVARYGFEWLRPIGTKTNYCLVMSAAGAKERRIRNISDLAKKGRGKLRFCGNYEFMSRLDGLPGLKAHYNLRFAEETVCSYQERYDLVKDEKSDVSVGHTSDSQIEDFQFVILDDDMEFFPDYFETPIARNEALEMIPELRGALDSFTQLGISEMELTTLIQDYSDNPESLAMRAQLLLKTKE
jgi:glycine betaine/choline ABC-type transport system substrate-binding protein